MQQPSSHPKRKPRKNALEAAAGILAARAYTSFELRRKLYRKNCYEPAEIEQAIAQLESMGFLSDRKYCEDAVHILQNRGYGPIRIRTKLSLRGIPKEVLDEVLDDLIVSSDDPLEPFTSGALAVLRKNERRLLAEQDTRKRHVKALRLLATRGFIADTIYSALEEWEDSL